MKIHILSAEQYFEKHNTTEEMITQHLIDWDLSTSEKITNHIVQNQKKINQHLNNLSYLEKEFETASNPNKKAYFFTKLEFENESIRFLIQDSILVQNNLDSGILNKLQNNTQSNLQNNA